MAKGVLIDLTRCTGCRGCQVACKEWNQLPARRTVMVGDYTNPRRLSADCYTHIRFVENEEAGVPVWSFVKDQCLHCIDPACVSACPVGALIKTASGPVVYDYDRCIGCRYCMLACPFKIPKYEWDTNRPWVQKCTFCSERIRDDMPPACVKVCPTEALLFGDYGAILSEGERRLKARPDTYVDHIYGRSEAGGTLWMYLSDVPFEALGFKMDIPEISFPKLTRESLSQLPLSVFGLSAVLAGIAYFRNRGGKEDENGR
jgi:formate dehydrogenase iron-sulfur subunit